MKRLPIYAGIIAGAVLMFIAFGNSHEREKKLEQKTSHKGIKKPGSTFQDTLIINSSAAVFYQPDSLQYQRIKAVTETGIFDATTHEYSYQMKNARNFLTNHRRDLKILDVRNIRFISFSKSDGSRETIDLDKHDAFGMFVFDTKKSPLPVDMTNVNTQITDYFSKTVNEKQKK